MRIDRHVIKDIDPTSKKSEASHLGMSMALLVEVAIGEVHFAAMNGKRFRRIGKPLHNPS